MSVMASQTIQAPAPELPIRQLAVTWILTIPLVFFASPGRFFFQSVADDNPLSASNGSLASQSNPVMTAVVFAVVFGIVSLLAFPMFGQILAVASKAKLIVALAALTAFSCLWSELPARSVNLAVSMIFDTVFVFYLHVRFSKGRLLELFYMLGWLCLTASLVFVAVLPKYGLSHLDLQGKMWRGIYIGKNPAGDMTVFLLTVCFFIPARTISQKILRVLFVLMSMLLIAETRSTTSYLLLMALFAFVVAERFIRKLPVRDRTPIIAICMISSALFLSVITIYFSQIAYALGKDPTLSGRTDIWRMVIVSAMKRPFLGYGFGGFWNGFQGESAQVVLVSRWAIGGAHNGILETWLDLGLLGVAILVLLVIRAIRDAGSSLQHQSSSYLSWCCCIVFLTVIYNLDEAASITPNNLAWIMFLLAAIGLSDAATRERQESINA